MTDIQNVLLRKTSLRKACKELSLAEMEKLSENLSSIIEDRKQEDAESLEQNRAKIEKIEALKKDILSSGINFSELVKSIEGSTQKKAVVKPKYEIRDAEGELHQWSGRGRTPKVFQAFFAKGGTKEQCLIK